MHRMPLKWKHAFCSGGLVRGFPILTGISFGTYGQITMYYTYCFTFLASFWELFAKPVFVM